MTTTAPITGGRTRPRTVTVRPVTFPRLVAAEWVKIRSLRSTWWALGLATVLFPVLAAVRTSSIAGLVDVAPPGALADPAYLTSGTSLALLVLCGLAVVTVTSEYRTGQVRATLAAAPTRLPVLGAKVVVVVGVVLVTASVGVLAGWAAAAPWFDEIGLTVDLTDPEHARLLLGVPLYLATMAALAAAVGAVVRSTAAGIVAVLGLLFVVEPALAFVPLDAVQRASAYLPTAAGARLVTSDAVGSVVTGSQVTVLSPWAGYGVLLAWVVALLVVAAVLLRRRDA